MTTPVLPEFEELRIGLERLRTLLESLAVRGLRACGPDELAALAMHIEDLEKAGAPGAASALADLRTRIESGGRDAASALLLAQTTVRMLERLLTLRVVKAQYADALGGEETHEADEEGDE